MSVTVGVLYLNMTIFKIKIKLTKMDNLIRFLY